MCYINRSFYSASSSLSLEAGTKLHRNPVPELVILGRRKQISEAPNSFWSVSSCFAELTKKVLTLILTSLRV